MSLNDPQWGNRGNDNGGGRRPNQGPPDLEELWRDLNKKLSGVFGNKRSGGGGGDGNGQPPVEINPRFLGGGIGLLVALVLLVWLGSGFYIVDASQRGIVLPVRTLQGKHRIRLALAFALSDSVTRAREYLGSPNPRGRIPWQREKQEPKEALMLTDDENIINIQFAVQYILKDPVDYIFNNRGPDEAVMQVAETAIREIVGKSRWILCSTKGGSRSP